MRQYLDGIKYILDNGVMRADRTGKGRLTVFCPPQERYRMKEGLPLDTTRKLSVKAPVQELLWFISGDTNIDTLPTKFFWDRWALTPEQVNAFVEKHNLTMTEELVDRIGTIGNLYGVSWRNAPGPVGEHCLPWREAHHFPRKFLQKHMASVCVVMDAPVFTDVDAFRTFLATDHEDPTWATLKIESLKRLNKLYWRKTDQLNEVIIGIKEKPFSSRLRVTAMLPQYTAFEDFSISENIADGRAALTPCHAMFQFNVMPGAEGAPNILNLSLTMTSNDYPVGRAYNISQYSILLCMVAQVTDCEPGELIVNVNDGHIYADQIPFAQEHVTRTPFPNPKLKLNPEIKCLFDFTEKDIEIIGYESHPAIPYPIAV